MSVTWRSNQDCVNIRCLPHSGRIPLCGYVMGDDKVEDNEEKKQKSNGSFYMRNVFGFVYN